MATTPTDVLHALYGQFLENGVRYFFPTCRLEMTGSAPRDVPAMAIRDLPDGSLEIDCFGLRYAFACRRPTAHQRRLIEAVGGVLTARFRSILEAGSTPLSANLFQGLPEDRFVSAFLDRALPANVDVIADAIRVLRESSLVTYENRRISTGVLLYGAGRDPHHAPPQPPEGALPYKTRLVSIKSFNRICDGLRTLFLVNREGLLVDLVDVRHWSLPCSRKPSPAPMADRYCAHAAATLDGGHICLVLTPNGEIKVFAEGAQVFHFMEGRWQLTDLVEKYRLWQSAIGDARLAERLFTVALNLAENRRGGLFVVLDEAAAARGLVAPGDLVSESGGSKGQVHYLLRGKRVHDMEPAVLESIARVDGGVVLDRESRLLAFGAILRQSSDYCESQVPEGGRTTAAVYASRTGHVLKISEDGQVSYYRDGTCLWEI